MVHLDALPIQCILESIFILYWLVHSNLKNKPTLETHSEDLEITNML